MRLILNFFFLFPQIFEMIFEMRADAYYHLGLPNCPESQIEMKSDDPSNLKDTLPNYSAYIVVDHKYGQHIAFPGQKRMNLQQKIQKDYISPPAERIETNQTMMLSKMQEQDEENKRDDDEEDEEEEDDDGKNVSYTKESEGINSEPLAEEPLTVVTHLSLTKAAMIVIVAMKKEKGQ